MTAKEEGRPQAASHSLSGDQDFPASVRPNTPTAADLAHPIVALVAELRPDVPISVIASLVVEALDLAACMILDGQWAEARQAAWPEAIKLAHARHLAACDVRRAAEWADVAPRPGDYMGRWRRPEVA